MIWAACGPVFDGKSEPPVCDRCYRRPRPATLRSEVADGPGDRGHCRHRTRFLTAPRHSGGSPGAAQPPL